VAVQFVSSPCPVNFSVLESCVKGLTSLLGGLRPWKSQSTSVSAKAPPNFWRVDKLSGADPGGPGGPDPCLYKLP
jgi:hypothetical protein